MKHQIVGLALIFSLLLNIKLHAQDFSLKDVPMNDQKVVTYTGDIDVPGLKKDSLYRKAFASLKAMYRGFAGKLSKNDPNEGRMIVNGVMQSTAADESTGDAVPDARVKYTLIITIVDGKLTYTYTNFIVEKGKKHPLESYYYNEPDVKMSKQKQLDFFHSIDYQMKSDIITLTRKLTN